MSLERQDYPAILPQLQPAQAVDILNQRVQQVGRLNVAIADWLQERRRLEEQYAAGLRKLARHSLDSGDLGVFSVAWSTLTGSADTLADMHGTLASRIESDIEKPLRNFTSTNREMVQMTTAQGNLAALAKDVERAQEKVEKQAGKGDKADASKVATANSELDAAQTQWESQAPYIFSNLQTLDEERLTHLRDVLTQFQTHEGDQAEHMGEPAEQCLNVLLNVEIADEVKTFALKAPQSRPTLARPKRNSFATPSRSLQPPPSSSSNNLAPSSPFPDDEAPAALPEDKGKGRLKGLRRLGTVMGRKRESKLPAGLPPTSESPERKPRPSPFNQFSSRLGRSKESTPTLGSLSEASPRERPRSPQRFGSELFDSPADARAAPSSPTPAAQQTEQPSTNGTAAASGIAAAGVASAAALSIPNGSHQGDLADLEPPRPAQAEQATAPAELRSDNEGYSVPPQNLDPISQAQQEASMEGGSSPLNVNIRDAPIQDDAGTSEAALASVAGKLQAPPTTMARRAGTVRGRRDNRNSAVPTGYAPPGQTIRESTPEPSPSGPREVTEPAAVEDTAPAPAVQPPADTSLSQSQSGGFGQVAASTFSPFAESQQQNPPSLRPDSRATTALGGDTQSIRSATTTGSQGGHKHPDLSESGLNASIIETVNARFDNGKLTSSSIIGDIALAYNPANFSSPFDTQKIRLERFSSLEKVAPNPAFITPSSETEGEYSVNLSTLGRTQVAFKYQARLDDNNSPAPILLAPAFRPEPNQFSVIIQYSLNPTFPLNGRESVTLSNATVAFTLEGAKATSCQSKPAGTFLREKNLIYWQLNDLTLTPGAAPQKLVVRFVTESQASGGAVESRWEISGEQAQSFGSGLALSMPGQSGSGSDPFADEDGQAGSWKAVAGVKKLVSGNYAAR
ncbi:Suppressor of Profilin deletion [Saxophila tyrrhenica]|uniref:Suppressor of Profilin deletion n=1 Tax=Saxophila tyrrhenica TaxID=1690608 RepID=A0AAV9P995_9PEZI|nr:Suppressor of Profilin deletion [Saxophila tyrrhenica]